MTLGFPTEIDIGVAISNYNFLSSLQVGPSHGSGFPSGPPRQLAQRSSREDSDLDLVGMSVNILFYRQDVCCLTNSFFFPEHFVVLTCGRMFDLSLPFRLPCHSSGVKGCVLGTLVLGGGVPAVLAASPVTSSQAIMPHFTP